MNPQNKVAVVTGANRGLGFEASRQLAKQGYHVILTSRNEEKGQKATQILQNEGLKITFHILDVNSDESCQKLAEFIQEKFGKLDVLINNAGILIDPKDQGQSIFESEIETWEKTMETNVYGVFRVTKALVPLMKKQRYGRIVNVSSGMGQLSHMDAGYPGYRLSKTALNALTRMLANELQINNILVNSICPGWVKTDMGGSEAPRTPEKGVDTMIWLATLPDGSATGNFFRDHQPIAW
ncbi:SDR family oxidoreductase [Sphaerospermopsis aphanizomenoides BCCUSP55]|uniref:SDR family oxidoreductase n=1 Tax=Sphaerospermopsis aphanizomenoides TaxID=459663 RepID=UPI000B1C2340|nr:SDR family oxidoreductase [Sphaerospermopsis aphanizomenoides]MBK1990709.1 SDR family oxidoreductase [Sphaerospermopsis aphanizomenoides BCCUSP55]